MRIKYKITEVHPSDHLIVVRFFTDSITEKVLATQWNEDGSILRCRTDMAVQVPIPAPTGKDLEDFIMAHCPTEFFEIQQAVANPFVDTSMASLVAMQGKVCNAPARPEADPVERQVTPVLQRRMDEVAQAKGYFNIFTAASYAGRDNEYREEGEAFFDWRSKVWKYRDALAAAISVGTRSIPDAATVLREMPQPPKNLLT